jgi:outer membrane protein OmpA-like peptidoglycan-associated protein
VERHTGGLFVKAESTTEVDRRGTKHRDPLKRRPNKVSVIVVVAVLIVVASVLVQQNEVNAGAGDSARNYTVASATSMSEFPNGEADSADPSGLAPPSPSGFPGYVETYVNNFTGTTIPVGWTVFEGTDTIDHDTGEQFAASHDVVGDGVLSLNTWMDPAYGNEWVTGGICRCQDSKTYGAYFVRSRQTGPGPTGVDLLWPTSNTWPPEIDFNETVGVTNATTATVIWGDAGGQRQQSQLALNIDMTQWHTWGVIWTPTSILYTVDGRVWGQFDVPSEIPNVPMTLHIQSQTWCVFNYACPTSPQSTQVDWVAEYSPVASYTKSVGTFASSSWTLDANLRNQISELAAVIDAQGDPSVDLVGYSDSHTSASKASVVSLHRALSVRGSLLSDLHKLNDRAVAVSITPTNTVDPSTFTSTPAWRSRNATVVVRVHDASAG